ncbi:hypothetical protein K6V78_02260 [Streptococcus gallolyticus]|nr:hypothetical protein [Streptococcus gallolyticus]MBY5040463.1 hypothetical protein [Streptococcus gallolyticus]
MDKENMLLFIIEDLKQKLADSQHEASDYRAQAYFANQKVAELEFVQTVIDGTPELKAQFEEALKKLKEESDGLRDLQQVLS